MCDQQEKVKNHKAEGKSHQMKRHHNKQNRHQQQSIHPPENVYQDMLSTEEDSLLSDCAPRRRRSHGYYTKPNHGRPSLSETSFTSSYGSSSPSSSSSTASSSGSSSSNSSSTSSLSSESSTDGSDTFLLRRPPHSLSCNNLSEKPKYVDDSATWSDHRSRVGKQKRSKGTQRKTGESIRKSKSMEALTHPREQRSFANQEEEDRRKSEVKKNLMKEKMKFSAFLNEITRQVLSPMRLTTLGVTGAQKASGVEPASVRSRKSESSVERRRSRPVSADSANSSQRSRTQVPNSKSSRHRRSHGSPDSFADVESRPRSCTDLNCLDQHSSWSQTSSRRSRPPYDKQRRGRISGDRTRHCRHRSDRHSPSYPSRHKGHHPHQRRCYTPVFYPDRGDCESSGSHPSKHSTRHYHEDERDGDRYGVSTPCNRSDYRNVAAHQKGDPHFHHRGYYSHGDGRFSNTHHCEQPSRNQAATRHPISDSSSQHRKEHRGNHSKTKRPTTPRQANQVQSGDHPKSKHHHARHPNSKENYADHHGEAPLHGDHPRSQTSEFDRRGEPHRSGHPQQRGNPPSPNSQHHQGDEPNESHQPDNEASKGSHQEHRHGAHRSPHPPHYHADKHGRNLEGPQKEGHLQKHHERDGAHHQHHHGDHRSPSNHPQHEAHRSRIGHSKPRPTCPQKAPEHQDQHVDGESDGRQPPQQKDVLACKLDSSKKTGRVEEQTDFTGPSIPQEPTHGTDKIKVLENKNEGLHQNLLKQAVKMECFGEFLSSHKLLEEELQRTRAELSDLTESFKILHENCSSTQQTNSLLEQKLNSVTRSMEGERQRLSRRISVLTEQMAPANFANNVDTMNVNSAQHKSIERFHPDDPINQVMLPLAPPPVQFMDGQNYEKVKAAGQEQCLGSVPEEEESDWSEMGDEIPRFILTGSSRSQTWMRGDGDVDKDSESGGEEIIRLQSPRPLQIPHLQFTIHNEMLPAPPAILSPSSLPGESAFRIATSPNVGSTVLIRSASLEEIPLACHQMPKELRGTEAMMDLHQPADEANGDLDLDDEIIHHWRTNNNGDGAESAPCSLQSVERMLHQFSFEPQPIGGICQSRSELHGWTEGMAEEVLGGEQTQL
ncbi:uncharacterized protein LOC144067821 isoform X2 [Stigmatopora argus]